MLENWNYSSFFVRFYCPSILDLHGEERGSISNWAFGSRGSNCQRTKESLLIKHQVLLEEGAIENLRFVVKKWAWSERRAWCFSVGLIASPCTLCSRNLGKLYYTITNLWIYTFKNQKFSLQNLGKIFWHHFSISNWKKKTYWLKISFLWKIPALNFSY